MYETKYMYVLVFLLKIDRIAYYRLRFIIPYIKRESYYGAVIRRKSYFREVKQTVKVDNNRVTCPTNSGYNKNIFVL